jgi:capsular polysaccharide biosynthesis protein
MVHPFTRLNDQVTAGVTDQNFTFINESLTQRTLHSDSSTNSAKWFHPPKMLVQESSIKYIDEEVIFLGALSGHYGHFILEGLSRLWPFLDKESKQKKAVFISEVKNNKFLDLFELFGLKKENLIEINKTTRFKSIIIPEPSIRLHDYYHSKYKDTIDEIKKKIKPTVLDKVYFSKNYSKSGRAIGETVIQKVFVKNGYKIFYPEKMSLYETLSVMKGCMKFVASSGTNFHNSIFLNDGAECVCLNRSAHFHPIQTMIDKMRKLNVTYIDVYLTSSHESFGNAPCFMGSTKHLINYLQKSGLNYSHRNLFLEKIMRFFEYKWFITYRLLYIYLHKIIKKLKN